ncbi:hypothetical protein BaRGS_00005452 [Batillaria attramentaria]|uniref:BTB domain-containing protein n=1 Tax=Batillaria attramentaria TaxID=370345 RepID=A0ABD0LW54_9CAEN
MASPAKKLELDESSHSGPPPAHQETVSDKDAVVERYEKLFNNEQFSDIVLRVGDDRFYAHRFILVTASNVFEAMLGGGDRWKEAQQPEVCLSEDEECLPAFANFLRYLYCGEVLLTTSGVLPLLLLADKYEIAKLRETCLAYMTRHIVETADANRAVTWYLYAQMTGQTAFRDQCLSFILSNFDIVMKAVDWADLSLQELTGFLACSEMVVHSEAALWSYVEKWLLSENNKEDIESNLKEVLPLIRFTMMPPKSLLQVENSSLYRDHQQRFSGKLNHAYRRHSLVMDGGDETTSTSDSPREAYRNYYCEEYCLSHAFSLNGYADISKIESRITLDCSTRQRFVAPSRAKSEDLTLFSVYFFPRGYFTTLTIYGSYMGRQNNDVTLKVIRRRPDLLPMKVDVTLVLFGRQNGVKYAAFTHSCSMVFTKDNHTLSVEKFLDINSLMKENSPYLVDGNMEGTIFLKIQDVGNHLVKLEQGQE